MKNQKIKKGEEGYLRCQKKKTIFRTILLFALPLALYLTGLMVTGSNRNLLTIVAVLGCLPASRSAVNMIVTLRYHGIESEDARKIARHTGSCLALSELVFTSYEKNFEIHHMAYRNHCLIGYTKNPACDQKACETHLKSMCKKNGLTGIEVRIFGELPAYLNRLDALEKEKDEETPENAQRLRSLLLAISL